MAQHLKKSPIPLQELDVSLQIETANPFSKLHIDNERMPKIEVHFKKSGVEKLTSPRKSVELRENFDPHFGLEENLKA